MAQGKSSFVVVHPDRVNQVWDEVVEKLKGTFDFDRPEHVYEDLVDGKRILIYSQDAIAIVRNEGTILYLDYVGGKGIRGWKDDLDEVVALIAKGFGSKNIVAAGRKGWERIWPSFRNTGKMVFVRDI